MNSCKSAFLVPFFGKLPDYFDFWVKSCEANHEGFHWFVYSDMVKEIARPNSAVTIIPYTFDEMRKDFKKKLGIEIKGHQIRRVCDYRLLFYFIRREKENLDEYDFIGYTDVDMIYGKISDYLPSDMSQYSMICGHNHRPCGPFTLMNRSQIHRLMEWEGIKQEMENEKHRSFNESLKLKEILSQELPALCKADPLQPQRAGLDQRHHYVVWNGGEIMVHDRWFRKKPGAFYHFSRHKNKRRFNVDVTAMDHPSWVVFKRGILPAEPLLSRLKFFYSLYI